MGDTNYIAQIIELDGDILNSGVKGMKWGVRKAEKAQSQADRQAAYMNRKPGNQTGANKRKLGRLQAEADRRNRNVVKKSDKAAVKLGEIPNSQKGPESTADRYDRLLTKAKSQGANTFTDEELKFVSKRGEAINKVNRLNEKKPGWIRELTQQTIKEQTKKKMNSTIDAKVNKKSDK